MPLEIVERESAILPSGQTDAGYGQSYGILSRWMEASQQTRHEGEETGLSGSDGKRKAVWSGVTFNGPISGAPDHR